MKLAWKLAASGVLGALICTAPGAFAQSTVTSKKRIASDPAEIALSKVLQDAQAAMERKDFAAATQNYQDYLAKKPDDAQAHFNLGYAFMSMQKLGEAKGEYEKAISLDAKMAPAYLNLGLTLLDTDASAAVAPLQKAVEMMPNQAAPKFLLGTALEKVHKLPEAIEQYQAAVALDGADFNSRFALGRALLLSGRGQDAEPEFGAAVSIRPEAGPAHLGLARSLASSGHLDEADVEYSKYLQLQPTDISAHLDRASLLAQMKKFEDALSELDKAASAGPENAGTLKLRAQIYFAKERYDDAIPVLQKAQPLAPKDALIPAMLGHLYLEKKDYNNAVKELIAAIQLDPASDDVLKDLVLAHYLNKNYQAALDGTDLLSKREPLPPGNWFMRATCYDKLGQTANALDAYQHFLQLNKDQNNDMYFEASARVRTLARELEHKK